ncbi:MAG: cell division protein FtsZ [Kiloniellales bacterium]|nr:cell division protein FtsZ [Kiloniellales bacterium]
MTLNLNLPKTKEQLSPRITVIGVGGAGGNAVNNMIQSNLEGVDFVVANTDAQALAQTLCDRTIQLGRNITQGLGAGSRPDIGRAAAEEALDDILGQLEGSNMVFVTAGMGGGTGTGAAPVIARAAREAGLLTVGVITKPFHFEGVHRLRLAESGINELQEFVDTLIVIPNQNLFRVANEKTTFADAFKIADDVLDAGVRGVTDLMVMPGLINLDFADIRAVMTEMGKAMMGTGEAEGENRATDAAEAAISNPLLDDVSMKGARGVLINITGGADLTLFEVDEAANRIRDEVDPDANIIFGSTFVPNLDGRMRVSVVATGIDTGEAVAPRPAFSVVSGEADAVADDDELDDLGASDPSAHALRTRATLSGGRRRDFATAESDGNLAVDEDSLGEIEPLTAFDRGHPEEEEDELATRPRRAPGLFRSALRVGGAAKAEEPKRAERDRDWDNDQFMTPPALDRQGATGFAGEPAPERDEGDREPRLSPRAGQAPARDEPRRRKVRLFDRVAGAARAKQELDVAEDSAPVPEIRAASLNEPRVSSLEAAKPVASGHAEEELLDIPAFLRRQAN